MERNIVLPMTEKTVRELKLGDIVYLSGEVIQLLAPAHQRAIEYKKQTVICRLIWKTWRFIIRTAVLKNVRAACIATIWALPPVPE